LLLALCCLLFSAISLAQSASDSHESFTLSGTVVNSVTGEPVSRALVRINGEQQRNTFTDGEGRFQFEGMVPGEVMVMVQKPGYVDAPAHPGHGSRWLHVGPNTGLLALKLAPNGAIFGRIVDAAGQPIERVPLRLTARSFRDGRRRWDQRANADSDEDGHFRFANLAPGTYYIAAGPVVSDLKLPIAGDKPRTGFAHVYYPGVQELASAQPLQVAAGQQAEADFSLSAVPVYEISGTVSGQHPDQGVGVQVLTSSGDDISIPTHFSGETGGFKLEGLPAGSYIVRAFAGQSLRAEARTNVAADVQDLRLVLAPSVAIPVVVRPDSHSSNASATSSSDASLVSVRLLSTTPNSRDMFTSFQQNGPGHSALSFQNVEPGIYSAEFMPQNPWYVQSATCGQTNLLYDDLAIAPGQSCTVEIVLRDDSANLSATINSSESSTAPVGLVLVPQGAGKLRPHVQRAMGNQFSVSGLAPGEYLVFAFDHVDDLEYANPDALEPYASQAAHITLTPNQKAQVTLDLIHVGTGE
jgi:hypothetical protein